VYLTLGRNLCQTRHCVKQVGCALQEVSTVMQGAY
jgi:hypothetical protein